MQGTLQEMEVELILQNIARHITLDKAEEDFLMGLLQPKKVKKKDFLLRPGDMGNHQSFVVKGSLRTYAIDKNGFEHNGYFAVEDYWTGDLHSFLAQTPATYYVEAIEDSEVLQISNLDLEDLYVEVPKFERFFRILFQKSLISELERGMRNISYTAEERYLHFIEKHPQWEQRIPQKHIASYLGITPEFLSVLRKRVAKG